MMGLSGLRRKLDQKYLNIKSTKNIVLPEYYASQDYRDYPKHRDCPRNRDCSKYRDSPKY